MTIELITFHIKRFRTLIDVKISISDSSPVTICGENNIGKTNFLRAMNLFFNHLKNEISFEPKIDIPHHIYYGSQGSSAKTEIIGSFKIDGTIRNIKATFKNDKTIVYSEGNSILSEAEFKQVVNNFKFFYIKSHNIDLPKLISVILEKDGLLSLDVKRKKQTDSLEKLQEFIHLSQKAISDIEKEINTLFTSLTDFDGILKGKQIKINFAEFEKLRDVIKTMTSITIYDGNNHGIASKGSGAQRAVFLTLMQFISKNYKENIIWGIDEPEVFLQPSLQKKVFEVLKSTVSEKHQPVIITTHSQHLINLKDLKNVHLFKGEVLQKEYTRRPNQVFYEINTSPVITGSDSEKLLLIKKHLGISNNDGWEVLPYNLLVEGEEDKKYLEILFKSLNLPVPNILFSGGASKIAGYLQYFNIFAKDLKGYRPKIVCIFDNDDEGREQSQKVRPNSLAYLDVSVTPLPNRDGQIHSKGSADWEIEDFLPVPLISEAINKILKKEKYSIIKTKQINEKDLPANKGTQILKYFESCCRQNNPTKDPLDIDQEGRKKQLCMKVCESIDLNELSVQLNQNQIEFLKGIADDQTL